MIIDKEPYKSLFTKVPIKTSKGLFAFYKKNKEMNRKSWWVFRGQRDAKWPLTTAIERLAVKEWKNEYKDLLEIEAGLIRSFQRRFHNYSNYIPEKDDCIEWLSIMQHHGTATRLLDCTYSFYAALFFALENATPSQKSMSAIWAFDSEWLVNQILPQLNEKEKEFYGISTFEKIVTTPKRDNYFLFKRKPSMLSIYPVNALRQNKRLIIQQGVFLAPGDINNSFIKNLAEITKNAKDRKKHLFCFLLPNTENFLKDTIRELNRMNMNSATLFPDLDGFARYLNKGVIIRPIIKVGENNCT
jgi:hypothetical protein